jgi:hypothetical protein
VPRAGLAESTLELLRAAGGVMATRMRANLAKQTPFT